MDLGAIQSDVGTWHESYFGKGRASRGMGRKLLEESAEFFTDPTQDEAADVLICLFAIAHREGWDLEQAVAQKLDILRHPERMQRQRDENRLLV